MNNNNIDHNETLIKKLRAEIEILKKEKKYYKYDHLTGFPLRKDFENMLDTLWHEHTDFGNRFIYAIVDINDLKKTNTDHGRLYGDAFIINVADQIKTVFEDSFIYRIGGDEFCILKKGNSIDKFTERLKTLDDVEYGVALVDDTTLCRDHDALSTIIDNTMTATKIDKKKRRREDEVQ